MVARKMTEKKIALARRLVAEGKLTNHQIAKRLGVSESTFYERLTSPRRNIQGRTRVAPQWLKQAECLVAENRLSLKEIAKQINVSVATLRYHFPPDRCNQLRREEQR